MGWHIEERTGARWPGLQRYRGPSSRRGYPTREAAELRRRVVERAWAARWGGSGPNLRVVARERRREVAP